MFFASLMNSIQEKISELKNPLSQDPDDPSDSFESTEPYDPPEDPFPCVTQMTGPKQT